ncbi:hypothetical protein BN10_1200011 [Phycicoccus elongatus Lp2]|uniref:Transposase n=1 Tax=Phycicoccus elongatus Lp2 TaxID=1193181 RepID=N0DXM9_9MICO|nr:hypothetical protein BN10_1200011 [Phycicoccus elongatus Lp2]
MAGEPPPRSSKSNYARSHRPVLQRPLELAQYTSVAFTTELLEHGMAGSIGTVGDALDNALCESTNRLVQDRGHQRRRSRMGRPSRRLSSPGSSAQPTTSPRASDT